MEIWQFIIYALVAYLLGSIPTSVWVGKAFFQKDVRELGSKNAGASNTFRTLGVPAGIFVLLVDVAKGFVATSLPLWMNFSDEYVFRIALAAIAVVGHIFPIFAGFRGGKGVATVLGGMIGIVPLVSLLCMLVYVLTLLIGRMSSLASMSGGIAFAMLIWFYMQPNDWSLKIFAIIVPLALIYTHRENVKRIFAGTESKLNFGKKKS